MERFRALPSLAGILQPGGATRYEMVAVKTYDSIEVIVQNDSFFDKIVFLPDSDEPYTTFRGDKTNPGTIRAAVEFKNKFIEEYL